MEFRSVHGRDPDTSHLETDLTELGKLRDIVLDKLNVTNKDIVPPDFAR